MAHHKKKRGPGPVPPGNRSRAGVSPASTADAAAHQPESARDPAQAAGQEQDPARRLGRYESAGEHAFVQPGEDRGDGRVGD